MSANDFNTPITPELVKEHGLNEEEYKLVLEIMGREPNINELGIFSVMWSEHCSYKSSKKMAQNPSDQGRLGHSGAGRKCRCY